MSRTIATILSVAAVGCAASRQPAQEPTRIVVEWNQPAAQAPAKPVEPKRAPAPQRRRAPNGRLHDGPATCPTADRAIAAINGLDTLGFVCEDWDVSSENPVDLAQWCVGSSKGERLFFGYIVGSLPSGERLLTVGVAPVSDPTHPEVCTYLFNGTDPSTSGHEVWL